MSVTTAIDSVNFGYDGFGRRVRKSTRSGTTTYYLHDSDALLAEVNASGNRIAEYTSYPGGVDTPHSMRRWTGASAATYYYAVDFPGSVTGLINSAGTLVARYYYGPFGALLNSDNYGPVGGPMTSVDTVPNPLRFAAREYDTETGLYFMRARYYDPGLGKFISEDPAGLWGGINPYSYASNDPVDFADPYGLDPCQPDVVEAGGISTQDPDTGKWWCVPYAVVTPIIIVASHIPPQTPWDPGLQSGPFAKPDGGGGGPTAPVLAPRAPSENNNACLLKASAAVWAVSEDVLALTGAGLAVKGLRGAQILAAGGTTLLLDQLGIEAAEIGSREMDKAIMRGTIRRAGSIAMASFVEAVANPGESDGWIGTVRSMVPIWNSLHAILSAVSTCRGGGSGE